MTHPVDKLEQRVADLVRLAERINRDNETLRNDQRILHKEIQTLQEKNKIAKGRIEQIVSRLKSLES